MKKIQSKKQKGAIKPIIAIIMQAPKQASPLPAVSQAAKVMGMNPSVGILGGSNSLPAKTLNLAVRQGLTNMANPNIMASDAISVFNQGNIINAYTIPATIKLTVSTATGYAGAPINLFNTGIYNNATANVTYAYGDGAAGNLYNALFATGVGATGILCYGFNISSTLNSVASTANIQNCNLTLNLANGYGGFAPNPIDLSMFFRNTQYQSGLLTVLTQFVFNITSQYSIVLPAYAVNPSTLTFTFSTVPIQ